MTERVACAPHLAMPMTPGTLECPMTAWLRRRVSRVLARSADSIDAPLLSLQNIHIMDVPLSIRNVEITIR
jgi:hypothetical protein